MKKRFAFIILISLAFVSCNQYKLDVEEFFEYWTNVVKITGDNLASLTKPNSSKSRLKSFENKTIIFTLRNPKNFELLQTGRVKFHIEDPPTQTMTSSPTGNTYHFSIGGG